MNDPLTHIESQKSMDRIGLDDSPPDFNEDIFQP